MKLHQILQWSDVPDIFILTHQGW